MSEDAAAAPGPAALPGSGPFLAKAPPLSLPMRHFAFAAAAFWIFAAAFARGSGRLLGFDFDALYALGLVHALTLGWITMTILGALCQLAPVLWEVSLANPRLIALAWWMFAIGASGFVGHLWSGLTNYWMPAALAVAAVFLYLFVFIRTMLRAAKLDWAGRHVAIAVCYFAAVAVLGILLAYDQETGVLFSDPTGVLIEHVHLALVGWVSLTIVGVSYRLVSMFALSHVESKTPGRLALVLANAGLIGLAVDSLFFGRRLLPVWASVLAAAYLAYAFQMRRIFQARNRKLDPALSFTLLALLGGFVWAGLGLALAFGRLVDDTNVRAAYIFTALLGWVTPFILSQTHKIVPFLVWLHVYSPRNWRPGVALKIPKIADLTSERLAWLELAALAPGIYLGTAGFYFESEVLLRASSWLILAAATLYLANTGKTLLHLVRKDPQWTPIDAQL